jgi:hypothetical protein
MRVLPCSSNSALALLIPSFSKITLKIFTVTKSDSSQRQSIEAAIDAFTKDYKSAELCSAVHPCIGANRRTGIVCLGQTGMRNALSCL